MQTAIMIMALTGLAAALRGSYLTARSLWFDEAWSVWLAQMPVDRMLATLRWLDAHPPLYYLLLRAWILGLGDSETSVRFLSVAVGSLTVTLTYVVATRWCDRTVAAVAAFFVAISPLHVMASQEARMYPLLGLLVLASTAALWEALQRSGRWWVAYSLIGAASLYTHYLAGLMMLAHGLYVVAIDRSRENTLRWTAAVVGMAVIFVPWLPSLLHHVMAGHGWPQWRPPFGVRTLLDLLALLGFGGYLFGSGTYHWFGSLAPGWYVPLLMPMVLLVIGGLTGSHVPRRVRSHLIAVLVVPLAAALSISLRWNIVYPRYFSFLVPFVVLAMACGMTRMDVASGKRGLHAAAILPVLLAYQLPVLVDYYTSPQLRVYDWRAAAALVSRHGRPGDLILLVPGSGRVAFDYYYRGPLRRVELTPVEYRGRVPALPGGGGDRTTLTTRHVEGLARQYGRLWLVLTPPEPPGARTRLTQLLEPFYGPGVGYDFGRVHVFVWERRTQHHGVPSLGLTNSK